MLFGHDVCQFVDFLHAQGGHSSGKPGKPGKVRELKSGQGKSGKIGKVREKSGKMNYYKYSVAASIVLMG